MLTAVASKSPGIEHEWRTDVEDVWVPALLQVWDTQL